MNRPRVVFVDHVARLSGAEIALLRLLPALAEHVDVHVVLGEDGPLVERLRAAGIAVEVLPLPPRLRDLRKDAARPAALDMRALLGLPQHVLRLARRFRELRADVVHTNTLKAALYGGAAGRLARVPVVWHVRDRISPDYLPPAAVRLVRAAGRVVPSAVVANSRATLATLPPSRHSRVVYNPVEPEARPPGPRSSFTVGVVGRLAPWKGQHVFLEAFAAAFGGSDARARIIGSVLFGEEAYAERLRAVAAELGVETQVEFRSFREDVWSELAALDVLVHSSIVPEPFGQVVLEGMAAGLPVVATAAGGPVELVTPEVDGLLVPPGDVAALAAALERLNGDPACRARLGAAAARRSRDFTPQRTAQAVVDVYATILRSGP